MKLFWCSVQRGYCRCGLIKLIQFSNMDLLVFAISNSHNSNVCDFQFFEAANRLYFEDTLAVVYHNISLNSIQCLAICACYGRIISMCSDICTHQSVKVNVMFPLHVVYYVCWGLQLCVYFFVLHMPYIIKCEYCTGEQ